MATGLVHVYYGLGKGKTTAAVGLATRAAGHGKRVLLVQFLKTRKSGEIVSLEKLPNITVWHGKSCHGFSWSMDEIQKAVTKEKQHQLLQSAIDAVMCSNYDLLVLDEALGACEHGFLEKESVLNFVRAKPDDVELVLTGRMPFTGLLELADYATEMQKVKHPYDKGIKARESVEY